MNLKPENAEAELSCLESQTQGLKLILGHRIDFTSQQPDEPITNLFGVPLTDELIGGCQSLVTAWCSAQGGRVFSPNQGMRGTYKARVAKFKR